MDKFVPHSIDAASSYETELMGEVKAGFPSPAEDIREKLDLIKLLVKHKVSTFFFRVDGVSMVDTRNGRRGYSHCRSRLDHYNNFC